MRIHKKSVLPTTGPKNEAVVGEAKLCRKAWLRVRRPGMTYLFPFYGMMR